MKIEPFRSGDIKPFLGLASAENWVAEAWEFEFLLSEFPRGCFSARAENGETAGFVTSLRHDKSAWIGNLIVAPAYRGQKIGERLFVSALEALWNDGVETVWLTASRAGMPLYQKFGFKGIDTIIRWSGNGRRRLAAHDAKTADSRLDPRVQAIDALGWGDRREALLDITTGRGKLQQQENGFVAVQPCGAVRQIGPFAASDYASADLLLKGALNSVAIGTKVCLDVPAANRSALRLYNRKGMRISGSNELMYAGVRPDYQPEYVYGLATMGSCG